MAHSNRKRLKDSRGGMTRNQARKARNSAKAGMSQSQRLQSVIKWMEDNEARKHIKPTSNITDSSVKKITRFDKSRRAIERRKFTLKRLENQLKVDLKQPRQTFLIMDAVPLTEYDKLRINKEIKVLKSRI